MSKSFLIDEQLKFEEVIPHNRFVASITDIKRSMLYVNPFNM